MASVHEKKDGRIFCIYYDNGKPVWEAFGRGPDAREQAETRRLEIELAQKKGTWKNTTRSGITFKALANDYIYSRQKELADGTREEILRAVNKYAIPAFGNNDISSITIRDWTAIHDKSIEDGADVNTINTRFRYLNKIFKWAVSQKLLKDNPWQDREPLKKKKYRVELFPLAELNKIIEHAPDHLRFILRLAYHTGARPGKSELFRIQEEDCDFKKCRIRIFSAKTAKTKPWRWQYIDPAFMREIKRRIDTRRKEGDKSTYLCTYNDQPLKKVQKSWTNAKLKAGIKRRIRLYDIRHFYVTHALAGGANPLDLAERVGHVDTTMMDKVYAHMVDEIRTKKPFLLPKLKTPKKRLLDKNIRQEKKERNKEKKAE